MKDSGFLQEKHKKRKDLPSGNVWAAIFMAFLPVIKANGDFKPVERARTAEKLRQGICRALPFRLKLSRLAASHGKIF